MQALPVPGNKANATLAWTQFWPDAAEIAVSCLEFTCIS